MQLWKIPAFSSAVIVKGSTSSQLTPMPEGPLLSSGTGQPTGGGAAVMSFCHLIQMESPGCSQTNPHLPEMRNWLFMHFLNMSSGKSFRCIQSLNIKPVENTLFLCTTSLLEMWALLLVWLSSADTQWIWLLSFSFPDCKSLLYYV